jgi:heme/copper-type cytochrome/quinol oxidase subunit 4
MKNKKFIYFPHVAVFIFFTLSSIYITYPLIFNLGSLSTGLGDELVMAWIHNWVIHALLTNPLALFEANLYYPNHNTLAFAESLIFTSILALPIQLIMKEPIVAVNFTFISSLILLGFSVYLLSYYLTKDYLVSLLTGILVIFSPAVLDHATHLQVLAIEWIPLAILFFLHFMKTNKTRFLFISMLFFLFQVYNSFMPAYFILISLLVIFIYQWFYDKKKARKLFSKKNILLVLATFILVIPVVLPYYAVSKEFHFVRDLRDAIHFAVQPEDLLYPSNHTRLNELLLSLPFNKYSQNNEFKSGYIGFVFSLLAIIAVIYFIKTFRKKNIFINSFVTIAIVGLVLSLGPFLHLGRQTIHYPFPIPLPYALFYYIFPGFQGFRNSARWEMLFILAIALAIALVLTQLLKKYSVKQKSLIYLLLIICSIAEFNFPMHFVNVPQQKDFPKVDHWLTSTSPESVIIHMPIYNWGSWPFTQNEIWREYYSTLHFRKMVNGYTSFSPPAWQEFIITMDKEFPDKKSVQIIKNLGVNYIIVDKDLYDKGYAVKQQKVNGDYVIDSLHQNSSLTFIKRNGNTYIFKLNN